VLFIFALITRVIYTSIAIDFGDPPIAGDGPDYDNIAYHLTQGQGFVEIWTEDTLAPYPSDSALYAILVDRIGQPPIFGHRPPGYPLFLAGIYSVFGRDFAAVRLMQIIVDSASVVLLTLLGFRWHSRRIGWIAGVLAAVNPLLIYYARMLTAESASIFMLLVLALLVSSFERSRRPSGILAAGIALGALLMLKSAFVLCAPALAAILAWRHIKEPRYAAVAVSLLTLGALLVAGPWIVRNEAIFGRYTISSQGGLAFSQRNNEVIARTPYCYGSWCPESVSEMIPASASENEKDRLGWEIGLSFVKDHPASFAKLSAYRVVRAFNPIPLGLLSGDRFSEQYAAKIFGYAWICPFFASGFLLGWRRMPLARDVTIALMGGMVCMLALASSGPRFIVPGIPLLLIWTAFSLSLLPGAIRKSG
jgi:4-amino-4-deoxy-L-arabinose transferase-like glycosyltransferase